MIVSFWSRIQSLSSGRFTTCSVHYVIDIWLSPGIRTQLMSGTLILYPGTLPFSSNHSQKIVSFWNIIQSHSSGRLIKNVLNECGNPTALSPSEWPHIGHRMSSDTGDDNDHSKTTTGLQLVHLNPIMATYKAFSFWKYSNATRIFISHRPCMFELKHDSKIAGR